MMAEPISSVLLIDYESLQRSLATVAGESRLADRAAAWLGAIESGRLIGPDGVRRHISVKRCYAGPSVRAKQRDALAGAGFDVVDIADGGARGSADLHVAMDTIEALTRPEGYQEFILLSTAMDLAPLLTRLKASNRRTAIFVDATTPENDKALADALLDGSEFARFLTGEETALAEIRAPSGGGERAEIEAFARRIHAATSIPLFSPRTFAELFRHLTEEIAANGYHFQTTAKNVADRMMASGRTVTRRQVVFIVKGLALKGHVFSTGDTAQGLAEVFREQARYLITNAGIALDARDEQLLSAWFLSHSAPHLPRLAPPSQPPANTSTPSAETKATIAETIEREVAKAVTRPQEKAKPPARATASAKPPAVKPVDLPKSGAPRSHPVKSSPSPAAREEAKAVIAARIAASAKLKNGSRPAVPAKPAPSPPAVPAPPERPPANRAPADSAASSAALENSILAAIAEAVDVLVEDSSDDDQPSREPPARQRQGAGRSLERSLPSSRARQTLVPEPEAAPEPEDNADSNDIGDQIQRIIASYNRNRTEE
jgi:hypothetical protein